MQTVVITGANRGLGLEFARQYAADGWQVVTLSRRTSPGLQALGTEYGIRILLADLVDDAALAAAVADLDVAAVDLLINNAGTMGDGSFAAEGIGYKPFGSFDRAEWRRVFDINVCTPMALTELLADRLAAAPRGIVVTLSSMMGSNALNTVGNSYAYRASKAAVNSLARSLGINLAARGIIAVALHPGWVRTELGGPAADLDIGASVTAMRATIAALGPEQAGAFLAYDGTPMPY